MIKYIFHILWIIIIITFILSSLFSIYNFGTFIDINLNTFALNNANDNKQLNNTINDFFKYTTDNINILLPTIPAINPIINIPDNLQNIIPTIPKPVINTNAINCSLDNISISYPDPIKVGECIAEKALIVAQAILDAANEARKVAEQAAADARKVAEQAAEFVISQAADIAAAANSASQAVIDTQRLAQQAIEQTTEKAISEIVINSNIIAEEVAKEGQKAINDAINIGNQGIQQATNVVNQANDALQSANDQLNKATEFASNIGPILNQSLQQIAQAESIALNTANTIKDGAIPLINGISNAAVGAENAARAAAAAAENAARAAANAARDAANAAANAARNAANAIARAFCITGNSLILMKNYNMKYIKNIKCGEFIISNNNNINKVISINKTKIIDDIYIYGFNDIEPFFTDSHPISTINNKVQSISPDLTLIENPERINCIIELIIGNKYYNINCNNNKLIKKIHNIYTITKKILPKHSYMYDLTLENYSNRSYIANNIIIESQDSNYSLFPCSTLILFKILLINYKKLKYFNKKFKNKYNNTNIILTDINNLNMDNIINNIIINNNSNINETNDNNIFLHNQQLVKQFYLNIPQLVENYINSDQYWCVLWQKYASKLNIFSYTNFNKIII